MKLNSYSVAAFVLTTLFTTTAHCACPGSLTKLTGAWIISHQGDWVDLKPTGGSGMVWNYAGKANGNNPLHVVTNCDGKFQKIDATLTTPQGVPYERIIGALNPDNPLEINGIADGKDPRQWRKK